MGTAHLEQSILVLGAPRAEERWKDCFEEGMARVGSYYADIWDQVKPLYHLKTEPLGFIPAGQACVRCQVFIILHLKVAEHQLTPLLPLRLPCTFGQHHQISILPFHTRVPISSPPAGQPNHTDQISWGSDTVSDRSLKSTSHQRCSDGHHWPPRERDL